MMGHYPTGVCVITATGEDAGNSGMVVGSFTSVSLTPPLIAFFPEKTSTSWPRIRDAGRFCVNVLASGQRDVCAQFAKRGTDKFAGISHRRSPNGSPIIEGVIAWVDCRQYAVHEAGDHFIVLGEVVAMGVEQPAAPLLFYRGGYGEFAAHVPV